MDFNQITQLITTLGFPIVCCGALGWFVYKVWKKQQDTMTAQYEAMAQRCLIREEKLYQQIDKFNDNLSNFNATLNRIDTRLETLEKQRVEENNIII